MKIKTLLLFVMAFKVIAPANAQLIKSYRTDTYTMKTLNKPLTALLIIVFISTMFLACEEESQDYEVRLRNNAHSESLDLVPTKYKITKFTIGDNTVENIDYGDFSDYFIIESGVEYDMQIEYDQYLWNRESQTWQFDQSNSDSMGPEEWGKDECDPQRIVINIKSALSLPVGAQYTVYCDD